MKILALVMKLPIIIAFALIKERTRSILSIPITRILPAPQHMPPRHQAINLHKKTSPSYPQARACFDSSNLLNYINTKDAKECETTKHAKNSHSLTFAFSPLGPEPRRRVVSHYFRSFASTQTKTKLENFPIAVSNFLYTFYAEKTNQQRGVLSKHCP